MNALALPPVPDDRAPPYVGLTDAECLTVAQAAGRLPGPWWMQRDEDDCGHASVGLVLEDGDADDDVAPVFLLWREEGLLRLGRGQGEAYVDLGVHSDVRAAMNAVQHTLDGAASAGQGIKGRTCAPARHKASPAGRCEGRTGQAARPRAGLFLVATTPAGFRDSRGAGHVRLAASLADQPRATCLPSTHL